MEHGMRIIRRRPAIRPEPVLDDYDVDYVPPEEPQPDLRREPLATRRPEPEYPADPKVWLESHKMTQTEVALRLANYFLVRRLVTADVNVSLTGRELTRREGPQFPVVRYLLNLGYKRPGLEFDWRGTYALGSAEHRLVLSHDEEVPDVVTTLRSGARFVGHVSKGTLMDGRNSAEHNLLRSALGRAITCEFAQPDDVIAAVVPLQALPPAGGQVPRGRGRGEGRDPHPRGGSRRHGGRPSACARLERHPARA